MLMNTQKVGILGGSFDPVHNAHIKLAQYAYDELQLEKVIFIPAYIQPFKLDKEVTDEYHRLNMLKLALQDYPYFEVSDIEIQMKGKSYTARTLEVLKKDFENMVFILGADSYLALGKWNHPEIIFQNAEIACAHRDGSTPALLHDKCAEYEAKYNGITHFLSMPDTDISSTDIREALKDNENVEKVIPYKVLSYIKENNLY